MSPFCHLIYAAAYQPPAIQSRGSAGTGRHQLPAPASCPMGGSSRSCLAPKILFAPGNVCTPCVHADCRVLGSWNVGISVWVCTRPIPEFRESRTGQNEAGHLFGTKIREKVAAEVQVLQGCVVGKGRLQCFAGLIRQPVFLDSTVERWWAKGGDFLKASGPWEGQPLPEFPFL